MCYTPVRKYQTYLIFDPLPNNAGHFVTVNVDDRALDGHLLEGGERACYGAQVVHAVDSS